MLAPAFMWLSRQTEEKKVGDKRWKIALLVWFSVGCQVLSMSQCFLMPGLHLLHGC